ncbi:MAG: hypothetical protein WBO46_14950 [Caldilineaceae bacterium]
MAVRFAVDIEGLEEDWVEVSESWTRAEVRGVNEAEEAALLGYLQRKLTACHLTRPGQEPLTDPALLDEERMDELDLRLIDFLGTVLIQAAVHLRSLGPLAGRLLLPGSDSSPTTATGPTKTPSG